MYDVNHKTATTSIEKFHVSLEDVLKKLSPLILSMNQEQFFIEEELIDPQIKTTRMANHFKKAEIQSISFINGLKLEQLLFFMEVFTDLSKYPTADSMITVLEAKGLAILVVFIRGSMRSSSIKNCSWFMERIRGDNFFNTSSSDTWNFSMELVAVL